MSSQIVKNLMNENKNQLKKLKEKRKTKEEEEWSKNLSTFIT